MSRRKPNLSKDFSSRLVELMERLGYGGRQRDGFAKKIGITGAFLSNVINLDSGPGFGLIYGLSKHFPEASIRWLMTGEGEPIEQPKAATVDPEKSELLQMTADILDSAGSYATSLASNIRSFHEAISMAQRLGVMENEITEIKRVMKSNSGRIREGDPPEKKEEITKERATSFG